MAEPLIVEVVSPEAVLYSGEADMVITRTLGGGEVAFQAGHAAFLGALVENHTRVFQTDGTVQDIAIHRGFVEVSGNPTRVSILSDTAELAQDIDVERAKEALERHRQMLRDQHMDATMIEVATAGRDRAEARLRATECVQFAAGALEPEKTGQFDDKARGVRGGGDLDAQRHLAPSGPHRGDRSAAQAGQTRRARGQRSPRPHHEQQP